MDFRPTNIFRRQIAAWRGLGGEFTRAIRREPFKVEYKGAWHLLIAYETAQRLDGETIVDGLPRSHLLACRPRLFFESTALWQTALKLKGLIETGPTASSLYAEALAVVLLHELLDSPRASTPRARGGLAYSRRRPVLQYIEEHFAHEISLSTLASVAQLSPCHFLRAFKQSFGVPPHRYHAQKRIERAKELLADHNLSLLQIAIELGFADASSFSFAFRKIARQPPSAYRRSLL